MYNLKERNDWGQGILWGYTYYQKAMFISFKFCDKPWSINKKKSDQLLPSIHFNN